MADKKITEYGSLSAFSSYDKIPVVDVSDTTMAASGTTKFMLGSALLSYLSTYYAPITSVYGATRIISENHQFISGMTFKVYNVSWINEGFTYTSNFNEYVVISDGDDYYPRKDIVVLDLDDDTLDVVEGEAVADIAAEPSLLPNQLRLFVVDVPTGATSLTGITTGTMYDEAVDEYGGEWDVTASGGSVATSSTDDSSNGLYSIKFSTSGIGQYATLSVAEAIVVTGFGISFQFKQPVAHDYKFAILVYDTSANISYPVLNIEGDAYGLDSTSTAWQEVFISMPNVSSLDQIRIQNLKNDSTFYIDEVEYQYGLPEAEVLDYTPTGGYSGTAQDLINSISTYQVNVLQFVSDTATKTKILTRDNTQDTTIVTAAVNDAVSYCVANSVKELHFPDGLYIIDKVTIDDLDDFKLIGHGTTLQYNSGDAIIEIQNSDNVEIYGFEFTSTAVAYADVAFLRFDTANSFFNIHHNRFTNFQRTGIYATSFAGGTYTEGLIISDNIFTDVSNYSNDNQCGITLAGDGEYSRVVNNSFYDIPSAIRFVDGANGLFGWNICMQLNGDAYDASYTNGIVFCDDNSNSGKIDIIYNKINHNDSGIVPIVCKGDATKPQNAFKIIGNDILVSSHASKTQAIYVDDAPYTLIKNNKLRGNSSSANDTAIIIENSDYVVVDSNFIGYYDNGIELITSEYVKIGNHNVFLGIATDKYVIDSTSLNVDCEIFSFSISAYGADAAVSDTSPKYMPFDCFLVNYWISAGVAPTGDTLDVGFELNGVSKVSVDASIDATENTSLTGTNPTLTENVLSRGDQVMFPITNIGSSTAGQDVTVYMQIIRT